MSASRLRAGSNSTRGSLSEFGPALINAYVTGWGLSSHIGHGDDHLLFVGFDVSTPVQADAKFLRRIFMALVLLTLLTGGMAGLATVQAMSGIAEGCSSGCN
jgi:hypothetical protein